MKNYRKVDDFVAMYTGEPPAVPILIDYYDEWEVQLNRRTVELVMEGRELPSFALDVDFTDNGWQRGMGPSAPPPVDAMQFGKDLAYGMASRRIAPRDQNSYWIWCPSGSLYDSTSIALVVKGKSRADLTRLIDRDQLIHLRRDTWLRLAWSRPKSRDQKPLIRNLVGGEFNMPMESRAEIIASATADGVAILQSIEEREGAAWTA